MTADRSRCLALGAVLLLCGVGCSRGPQHRSDSEIALDSAVRVEAEGCRTQPSVGGGSFVGPNRVLTVAHVIAGATEVDIVLNDGTEHSATVVAIDRKKDLAVLAVNADVPSLVRGSMRSGAKGEFVVWRSGSATAVPFQARAFVDINASDIDHVEVGLRRGYEIVANIEPGDSGSVLVADGKAVAIVFARSTRQPDRAWATDIAEAKVLMAEAGDTEVDVGACA